MLLSLFDEDHTSHGKAVTWWETNPAGGWASCPLTQNGFVRIVSGQGYERPYTSRQARETFDAWVSRSDHVFWTDDVSFLDRTVFNHDRILSPHQITDVYLLALAVKHGARFVTLDRGVPIGAVRGATAEHYVMV